MTARTIERQTINSRLLKNYGSWLYCTNCNKTVAYICYSTYHWVRMSFQCSCGSKGNLELKEAGAIIAEQIEQDNELIVVNNRYCCPVDAKPLFSIVTKQVIMLEYEVSCLECKASYRGLFQANRT